MPETENRLPQEVPIDTPFFEIPITGEFGKSDVEIVDTGKRLQFSDQNQEKIDKIWIKRKAEVEARGGFLEDWPKFTVLKREVKFDRLLVELGHSTYKECVALTDSDLRSQIPKDKLPIYLGVATLLETADNYLILNERSLSVFQHNGWLSVFAGLTEKEDLNEKGQVDPFVTAQRELKEEIQIENLPITDIKCLGIAKDKSIGDESMLFLAKTSLTKKEIQNRQSGKILDEGKSVFIVANAQNVRKEILEYSKIFVSDGAAPMLLYGRKKFGQEWFNFVLTRLQRRGKVYETFTEKQKGIIEERLIKKLSRQTAKAESA